MKYWLPIVVSAALLVSACGSDKTRSDAGAVPQTNAPYTDSISPLPSTLDGGYDATVAAERALTTNLIYFDFDDTAIKPQYQSVIDAYSTYLQANPTAKIRLEGHADERGTREYNIGLGERRAKAVEAALLNSGVSAVQLSVISYGEERPADEGHNDQAWSLNRRVQLVRQ